MERAARGGARSAWTYQSYEGRTVIKADAAKAGGVKTERAGAAVLGETLPLSGRVELTPEGQSEVYARYPGRVMALSAALGQRVVRGQVLARVESSDSLQTYLGVTRDSLRVAFSTIKEKHNNTSEALEVADKSTKAHETIKYIHFNDVGRDSLLSKLYPSFRPVR